MEQVRGFFPVHVERRDGELAPQHEGQYNNLTCVSLQSECGFCKSSFKWPIKTGFIVYPVSSGPLISNNACRCSRCTILIYQSVFCADIWLEAFSFVPGFRAGVNFLIANRQTDITTAFTATLGRSMKPSESFIDHSGCAFMHC